MVHRKLLKAHLACIFVFCIVIFDTYPVLNTSYLPSNRKDKHLYYLIHGYLGISIFLPLAHLDCFTLKCMRFIRECVFVQTTSYFLFNANNFKISNFLSNALCIKSGIVAGSDEIYTLYFYEVLINHLLKNNFTNLC